MDIDSCLAAIKSSGVVAFPTDTFFALSCDPLRADALAKLRELKGLTADRPLPVLIPQDPDLTALGCTVPPPYRPLLKRYWPGKLTAIVPCSGPLAEAVGRSKDGAVGLRVPGWPWLLQLLARFRAPLVGTSANPSGLPPARSAPVVRHYFGDEVDWVRNEDSGGEEPSTVVDCTGREPVIIREGAIPTVEVMMVFSGARLP